MTRNGLTSGPGRKGEFESMSGTRRPTNGSPEYLFRYEDILRAIGRYIDDHGVQDVVLLQLDSGILMRGLEPASPKSGGEKALVEHLFTAKEMVEHVFTPEDLRRIDEAAKKDRGQGSPLFH